MKFRLFTVFLVGFATAFNTFAINAGGRPLSVGLLAVVLYFFSIANMPIMKNIGVYKANLGSFIFLPFTYTILLTFMNLLYSNSLVGLFPQAYFMDWVLFLALLAHSIKENKAIDYCLYGLSMGAMVLSVLFFLGIGVEVNLTQDGDRLSMFGSNENVLGIIQSLSSCIILNMFIIRDRLGVGWFRWLFLLPLLLSASMILATGSRTSLLILVVIYVVSILTMQTRKKVVKYVVIVVGVTALVYAVEEFLLSDSPMAVRVLTTIDEGDTGGRTNIWLAYLSYFPDHPIFGVGESGMIDIAKASGVGTTKVMNSVVALSPHNVIIEVLMTTGMVGFVLMFVFWKNVFMSAFNAFIKNKYSIPMIFLIPIGAVIMSGQILGEKYAWIIYAYMLAANMGYYHKIELNKQ